MNEQTPEQLRDALAATRAALAYAIKVIESYQFDIRNAADAGITADLTGFCAGEFYRDALADIQKLRKE